jgi:hypothetical protein
MRATSTFPFASASLDLRSSTTTCFSDLAAWRPTCLDVKRIFVVISSMDGGGGARATGCIGGGGGACFFPKRPMSSRSRQFRAAARGGVRRSLRRLATVAVGATPRAP